jgi:hypothetical protein
MYAHSRAVDTYRQVMENTNYVYAPCHFSMFLNGRPIEGPACNTVCVIFMGTSAVRKSKPLLLPELKSQLN